MPNILDEIVEAKTKELAQQKQAVSLDYLKKAIASQPKALSLAAALGAGCLLYTSPSPRDVEESRMPSSA